MTRVLVGVLALGMVGLFSNCARRFAVASRVEEPEFKVVGQLGDDVELRQYPATIVAETLVEGDFDRGLNEGFRRLAGYIFGGNVSAQKIEMTAPVGMQASQEQGQKIAMTAPVGQVREGKGWRVTFTMPAEYSLSTLPRPRDARVTLREVPGQLCAATRFRGGWDQRAVEQRRDELVTRLAAMGLGAVAEPTLARYDPPWIPTFLRRNEIIVPVQWAQ